MLVMQTPHMDSCGEKLILYKTFPLYLYELLIKRDQMVSIDNTGSIA